MPREHRPPSSTTRSCGPWSQRQATRRGFCATAQRAEHDSRTSASGARSVTAWGCLQGTATGLVRPVQQEPTGTDPPAWVLGQLEVWRQLYPYRFVAEQHLGNIALAEERGPREVDVSRDGRHLGYGRALHAERHLSCAGVGPHPLRPGVERRREQKVNRDLNLVHLSRRTERQPNCGRRPTRLDRLPVDLGHEPDRTANNDFLEHAAWSGRR